MMLLLQHLQIVASFLLLEMKVQMQEVNLQHQLRVQIFTLFLPSVTETIGHHSATTEVLLIMLVQESPSTLLGRMEGTGLLAERPWRHLISQVSFSLVISLLMAQSMVTPMA